MSPAIVTPIAWPTFMRTPSLLPQPDLIVLTPTEEYTRMSDKNQSPCDGHCRNSRFSGRGRKFVKLATELYDSGLSKSLEGRSGSFSGFLR